MHLLALSEWFTADGLASMFGPWALAGFAAIIFVECGLFIGMFFPGDSLLFLIGILVATGQVTTPLWLVITVLYIAAVAGNMFGYQLGRAVGPKLFTRAESRFLRPEHVERTKVFFERYGNRAIVLARFVPIVRSLITAVAGIGQMDRRRFFIYSAVGAVFWVVLIVLLGVWLGQYEWVKRYLEVGVILFVILSCIPIYTEWRKAKRNAS